MSTIKKYELLRTSASNQTPCQQKQLSVDMAKNRSVRWIKEALWFRKIQPIMTVDKGRYEPRMGQFATLSGEHRMNVPKFSF